MQGAWDAPELVLGAADSMAPMHDDPPSGPRLPAHPQLRDIALAMERAGMAGEILDASFRTVYFSSEAARIMALSTDEWGRMYGRSLIVRSLREDADIVRVTDDSGAAWLRHNVPIMRRWLKPGEVRINDDAGRFVGVLHLTRGAIPESLLQRLGRGDPRLFARMERVSEPERT